MLGMGFLASLAREEKAGIEWRLFKTAVLEPSSGSLGSLGSLGLPWQQGAVLKKRVKGAIRQQALLRVARIHPASQATSHYLPCPKTGFPMSLGVVGRTKVTVTLLTMHRATW